MTYVDMLDSKYDNFFKTATAGGWANDTSGNVEAPTGWFAKMSVAPNEREELVAAFEEEFNQIEAARREKEAELIGYFGCEIDNQGFIWVYRFASQSDLDEWYQTHEDEYSIWNGDA